MVDVKQVVTRCGVVLVALGSLSATGVLGAGAAGAASPGTVSSSTPVPHGQSALHRMVCSHDAASLRNQAKFAAKTARIQDMAIAAQAAGDTRLADLYRSVVAHRKADQARMQARLNARITHDHTSGRTRGAC